ncbi:MAG TPA: phosphate ABC transporter substrate-binding protein [Marinobacter sp.]|uniref:Phosphate ABC transporter substrate-binding protein n=2 Tax=root TaxID=1 RepID=A0A831R3Q5_9GAMM|nr:substrate-binding domain-containing protein [Marinobacter antarcticus]HDZ39864.1 phosphate ABC transporter substrate-binding protein [Marinobacter sp.]HEA53572.1 phosphate ABC transporter substrate-binding protein [Marinobacter antarcticus]
MSRATRTPVTLFRLVLAATLSLSTQAYELEIHGSNTIGATLAPMLVTGFLEEKSDNPISSKGTGEANENVIFTRIGNRTTDVLVAAHGSSTGFKTLSAGNADIWASSRPVKPEEAEQLRGQADLTALENEHVIAIDGLAILVHPSNPINQMSIDTLGKIFSGQIQNWSELGGADRAIRLYARDNRSGTWDTFKSLILGKTYTLNDTAQRYESNDQLSDDVSQDPSGIGFSGLASVRNSKLLAISEGNAPALLPNQLTVASEDYPLSRRLFMYTIGEQTPPLAAGLIEFALGPKGQTLVAESGFISQNLIAIKPTLDDSAPDTFRRLIENYQRLTVNFRFSEGRTKLDNKAQRDLQRLQRYLEEENQSAGDLLLIGFADMQSHELRAQMISELRALSVRKALQQSGVPDVAYTGYGQYMPVGGSGNQRNGRVEIWIRSR